MISARALKAARVAARLQQQELAKLGHISVPTLKNMETSNQAVESCRSIALHNVLKSIEQCGVKIEEAHFPDGKRKYTISWEEVV